MGHGFGTNFNRIRKNDKKKRNGINSSTSDRRSPSRRIHINEKVVKWITTHLIRCPKSVFPKPAYPKCLIYKYYLIFCEDENLIPCSNNIFSKQLKHLIPELTNHRFGPRGGGIPFYSGFILSENLRLSVREKTPEIEKFINHQGSTISKPCISESNGDNYMTSDTDGNSQVYDSQTDDSCEISVSNEHLRIPDPISSEPSNEDIEIFMIFIRKINNLC